MASRLPRNEFPLFAKVVSGRSLGLRWLSVEKEASNMLPATQIAFEEIEALSRPARAAFVARCARLALGTLKIARVEPEPYFAAVCERAIRLIELAATTGEAPVELASARRAAAQLAFCFDGIPMRLRARIACAVTSAAAAVHDDSPMQALMAVTYAKTAGHAVGVHDVEEILSRELPVLRSAPAAYSVA
jgi:hypothetical protein